MANVVGVVTKKDHKKDAKWEKFSVLVNDVWYGGFIDGKNRHVMDITEGTLVDVTYTENGKYKNWTNIVVMEKPKLPAKDAAAPAPVKENNNQYRITYASARNAAIELTKVLVKMDMIKVPAKQADKADAVIEFVDALTDRYVKAAWNANPEDLNEETGAKPQAQEEESGVPWKE